ncbi:synaptobrevin-like protein [Achlya hypogyna]|uniref:Synaptobrevin-like protein n=1 Tax=Achlya hypogyna TaxID=1202772 RepID=A0A1V9ZTG4_ACHHY|nr:synaptobrevin-like protein [Achlya hypogyna]
MHRYPAPGGTLMNKMLEEYNKETNGEWARNPGNGSLDWAPLTKALEDYQDPTKADKISAIQKELDETTAVLSKTIDSVLERGEKIDDLVANSVDMRSQSKVFYKQPKKTYSCYVM